MNFLATVFTLFIVTNGADVKESQHPSLNACLEAKSLALYGKTIEQKKADDAAAAKADAEAKAKLDVEHPFHEPTNDEERREVKMGEYASSSCGGEQCITTEARNGKIRSYPETSRFVISGAYSDPAAIKVAECVVVPEAKP